MGADQFVGIRIVSHDVTALRYRNRVDGVGRKADGARQLHRAVLVGVFQTNIQNRGLIATIQTLFELFFADAFYGHGAILAAPQRIVKMG